MGLDLIEWTYDPLQAFNAHLNFARLGVVAHEYEENIYGASTSVLHRGNPDGSLRRRVVDSQAACRAADRRTEARRPRARGGRRPERQPRRRLTGMRRRRSGARRAAASASKFPSASPRCSPRSRSSRCGGGSRRARFSRPISRAVTGRSTSRSIARTAKARYLLETEPLARSLAPSVKPASAARGGALHGCGNVHLAAQFRDAASGSTRIARRAGTRLAAIASASRPPTRQRMSRDRPRSFRTASFRAAA